jgi:hypothetical protein
MDFPETVSMIIAYFITYLSKGKGVKMKNAIMIACLAGLLAACSVEMNNPEQTAQTWEKYQAEFVKPVNGGYLVEGDILCSTMDEVKQCYDGSGADGRSTVYNINGTRIVWTESQKKNITYRISDFGVNTQLVRNFMNRSTEAWERYADIDYIELGLNAPVQQVFTVRPATAWEELVYGGVVAYSFFPNYATKELVVFSVFFKYVDSIQSYIIKHELGHTLGLRHEHIWDFPGMEPPTDAELLNVVDSSSIMYYNYLPTYCGNQDISPLDINGVRILYGASKRLLLWSKLDSTRDMTSPTVGPTGSVTNYAVAEGKFGWAYSAGYANDNQLSFPASVINRDAGCIEFWAKLSDFNFGAAIPWGCYPSFFSTNYRATPEFHLMLNGNDGWGGGGLTGWAGNGNTAFYNYYQAPTYSQALGNATDWHHYALVWNKNGVPGTAFKVMVYLDGVAKTTSNICGEYHNPTLFADLPPTARLNLVENWGNAGTVVMDNIKIWSYAKTDFSDRIYE